MTWTEARNLKPGHIVAREGLVNRLTGKPQAWYFLRFDPRNNAVVIGRGTLTRSNRPAQQGYITERTAGEFELLEAITPRLAPLKASKLEEEVAAPRRPYNPLPGEETIARWHEGRAA